MKDSEAGYPQPSYAWYVVSVLTVGYVFSFLDRQILALLVEPIKRDLGITDTQMSLLLGLAFAIFYTLLGIPIGRWADRHSRRTIIGIGIVVWCIATVLCGLARNYTQLFAARIGVGAGEASLNPAALSLISDYFPAHKRGKPIGVFNMGSFLGSGLALILGGQLVSMLFDAPRITVPLLGELYAWQTAFIVVGVPGLIVAVLLVTVREPERRGSFALDADPGSGRQISVQAAAGYLVARWRSYAGLILPMSCATVLGYGFLSWMPTMFLRTWDWEIGRIALAQGIVLLVCAPVGVLAGGWLVDRLYESGTKDAHLRVFLGGATVLLVTSVVLPLMPTPEAAIAVFVPMATASASLPGAVTAALMIITPNQLRAQVAAVYYFMINLLGLTVGPIAVALVTDYGFKDESALPFSMSIVAGISGALTCLIAFLALAHFRASVLEAEGSAASVGAT